jgi:glycosyltransferase involved in cell wall biosynthesis
MIPLQIAYLCGSMSWGGLEMNQLRNAIWMKNRGHRVVLIGWEGSPIIQAAQNRELETFCIPKYRKYYPIISAYKLANWISLKKMDYIFVRAYTDLSLASGISFWGFGKLKVYYFMEMNLGGSKKQFFRTLRFKRLAGWCCPLESLKQQTIANTNFDPKKIHVIPSGIDFSHVVKESKIESRKKLGLPEDVFLFGLVGRIDPQKGQLHAVKALEKISDDHIKLVIVGEKTKGEASNYEQELLAFIRSKNLENRVIFLPFQQNPFVVFNAFDWTLMASLSETVGMVTIESMAQGTPVIGSNAGGTPEILHYGKAGLLFEPGNENDLADKMKQSISFFGFQTQKAVANFNHHYVCTKVEELLSTQANKT